MRREPHKRSRKASFLAIVPLFLPSFLFFPFLLFPSHYHRDSSRKVRVVHRTGLRNDRLEKKLVFPRRIDPRTSQREISRNRTQTRSPRPELTIVHACYIIGTPAFVIERAPVIFLSRG